MLKKLSILLLIALCSNAMALQPNAFDPALKEIGAVDENYKYSDFKAVSEYFRVLTTNLSYSYPVKVDATKSIKSVYMTPYTSYVTYRFLINFPDDKKTEYQSLVTSPEGYKNWCNVFYIAKFMYANNYKFEITFEDLNFDTIATIKIDSKTCSEVY